MSGKGSGGRRVSMNLDFTLSQVNEPQQIDAPSKVKNTLPSGAFGQLATGFVAGLGNTVGVTPDDLRLGVPVTNSHVKAERAVADNKKVVIFFQNPRALDDQAVADSVRSLDRRTKKVVVLTDDVRNADRYGTLLEDLGVSQAPAIVVIGRSGKAELVEGYVDAGLARPGSRGRAMSKKEGAAAPLHAVPEGGPRLRAWQRPHGLRHDEGGARASSPTSSSSSASSPRERVDAAVEEGKATGRSAEQVLLESGALTGDQLARAIAERFGLDHVDLTIYKPDVSALNSITAAGGPPPQRRPDRLRRQRHAAGRDGRPVERARARRPQADDRQRGAAGRGVARRHRRPDRPR